MPLSKSRTVLDADQVQFAQIQRLRLAHTVSARRAELNLSLKEAAALAGLTPDQWAAIESGEWVPVMSELEPVCLALDLAFYETSFLAEISRHWQNQ